MSNYVKIAEENGDRYLTALEKGQESFLKYVAALNAWTPRPAGAMAGVSLLRSFSDAGFAFSEKLLQQQKAFSEMLVAQTGTPSRSAPKLASVSKAKTARKAKKSPSSATAAERSKAGTGSASAGKPAQAAAKPTDAPVVKSSKKKPVTRTNSGQSSKS